MTSHTSKPALTIHLAAPRGFCAGVVRAIDIVEAALTKFGAPVYVRHEIVHNRYVVENLERKGAVFVKELDECPQDRPVIFSAHGVPKSVPAAAEARQMLYVDATCPLVSKVHREAERAHKDGKTVILVGHAGHPEVIGTMGQLPEGAVTLVETIEDVATLSFPADAPLAYCTQTTLSVDDTQGIVDALKARFTAIQAPKAEDICYATTNRQEAVKDIAEGCDLFITVGAPNSSNSNRLVEVAARAGAKQSILLQRGAELDPAAFPDLKNVGLSAGASAPEVLVDEVIDRFREHYDVTVNVDPLKTEKVRFKMPRILSDAA